MLVVVVVCLFRVWPSQGSYQLTAAPVCLTGEPTNWSRDIWLWNIVTRPPAGRRPSIARVNLWIVKIGGGSPQNRRSRPLSLDPRALSQAAVRAALSAFSLFFALFFLLHFCRFLPLQHVLFSTDNKKFWGMICHLRLIIVYSFHISLRIIRKNQNF